MTGRYKVPKITRENRTCRLCNILEDEYHALFICPAHIFIRQKYETLLRDYTSVSNILNPKVNNEIKNIAMYLKEIEENMNTPDMVQ